VSGPTWFVNTRGELHGDKLQHVIDRLLGDFAAEFVLEVRAALLKHCLMPLGDAHQSRAQALDEVPLAGLHLVERCLGVVHKAALGFVVPLDSLGKVRLGGLETPACVLVRLLGQLVAILSGSFAGTLAQLEILLGPLDVSGPGAPQGSRRRLQSTHGIVTLTDLSLM
jgi:hypothetical protein